VGRALDGEGQFGGGCGVWSDGAVYSDGGACSTF
jgi:hypothetical protein